MKNILKYLFPPRGTTTKTTLKSPYFHKKSAKTIAKLT